MTLDIATAFDLCWWYLFGGLLHGEVTRIIVFYGGNDGLDELEEDHEVHVHTQLSTALCHSLYDLLHHISVSANKQTNKIQFKVRTQNSTARHGTAGQGRAGQGRAGQGRAGQGRVGQGRAGQGTSLHVTALHVTDNILWKGIKSVAPIFPDSYQQICPSREYGLLKMVGDNSYFLVDEGTFYSTQFCSRGCLL